jgi:hypothetical protein
MECWKFLHSKQEVTGPLSGELRAREPVSLILGSWCDQSLSCCICFFELIRISGLPL